MVMASNRVATFLRYLNTAESHYPTFEQELLALKKGMEQWRHYLLPIRFLARTDHNGLKAARVFIGYTITVSITLKGWGKA